MKRSSKLGLIGLGIPILCLVAILVIEARFAPIEPAEGLRSNRSAAAEPVPQRRPAPGRLPVAVPTTPEIAAAQPGSDKQFAENTRPGSTSNASSNQGDAPPTDELARAALSLVGVDLFAEEYWIEAINDPALPADERSNLIEDLNEDGLADPKHPTPEDLPLILNRLALIEDLAGSAMDQVNADAFQEAYKDLLNLAEVAVGRGEPVR